MTQPRGPQIKSVNTKYAVLAISVVPGTPETVFPISSLPAGIFVGGADEDVPGRIRGTTVSPFSVLAGDSFTVRVDGAPPVVVMFAAADTTVGRVALKINAIVGSPIASNDAGFLVLTSTTVGAESSVELVSESPAGVLSKLGLMVGKYSGVSSPADGVVTLSADGLGGSAPYATDDGKNLVTDGSKLIYISHVNGFSSGRKMMQVLSGGLPVVGKLTSNGTSVIVSYHAKATPRAKVRSLGSTFSLLDGSNTLTLNVNGQGFNVTFGSPPYTRDQVLDAINAAYAVAMGISDPWARVDGTTPGPFRGLSGTSFKVEVDGGSPQTVSFTAEQTVAEVANHINGTVAGVTASVVSGVNSQYLAIRSNNSNGRTSSIKIYSGDQSLFRIGIRPGFYGGTYVADGYGPDEIEIISSYRGYANGGFPDLSVSGSGTTLARTGLIAATISGFGDARYEPVNAPFFDAAMTNTAFSALMCYPVVREFGDVPADTDSVVQEYLAKSAGSNIDGRNRAVNDSQSGSVQTTSASRGFFDVGKPVVMSSDGQIPLDNGGGDANSVDAIVKQITRVNVSDIVQAVVGSRFETPGSVLPPAPFMDFYVDPTDAFSTVARGFRFSGPEGVFAKLVDDVSGTTPLLRSYASLHGAGRSLYFPDGAAKVSDQNISAIEPTNGYMPLSSSTDSYLKIAGKRALPSLVAGYNLLQSVNSRYEVTLGDGTDSFGDFNGPGALKKARDFLVSAGAVRARIVFQPGSYSEAVSSDFSGFLSLDMDGIYPPGTTSSAVLLTFGDGSLTDNGIVAATQMESFKIRNMEVAHYTPNRDAVFVAANNVEVDGCFLRSPVTFTNPFLLDFKNTMGNVDVSTAYAVRAIYNDAGIPGAVAYADIRIHDCNLSSGQNAAIIRIDSEVVSKLVRFRALEISRCVMTPGNCTVISQVVQALNGIGILGIDPSVSAFSGADVGFVFEHVKVVDTDIISGTIGFLGTYAPTAIFLLPGGADGPASWNYASSPGSMLNQVTIENVNVSIVNGTSFQTASGMNLTTVCVGGVGALASPANPAKVPDQLGVLTVKNLSIDCQRAVFGPASTSMITFFADYRSPSGVIDDIPAGLIALSGTHVKVETIVVKNSLSDGGNPALFVASYAEISLNGFYESPSFLSLGLLVPNSRIQFRDVFISSMVIKNIHIWGGFNIGDWWNIGAICFEAMNPSYRHRVLSDFSITGFFTSSGALNSGVALNGFIYPTNCIPNNQGVCGGITIERGSIGNDLLNTFRGMNYGIILSQNVTLRGGNVTIRSVNIDTAYFSGIRGDFGTLIGPVVVEDCSVLFCGNSTSSSGVNLTSSNTSITHAPFYPPAGFVLRGNNVSCNASISFTSYSGVQINVRDVNSNSGTKLFFGTRVSMFGNYCSDGLGSMAKINSCQGYNVDLPNAVSSADFPIFGLETGYSGQTGIYATLGQGKAWFIGAKMMNNYATLSVLAGYSG